MLGQGCRPVAGVYARLVLTSETVLRDW